MFSLWCWFDNMCRHYVEVVECLLKCVLCVSKNFLQNNNSKHWFLVLPKYLNGITHTIRLIDTYGRTANGLVHGILMIAGNRCYIVHMQQEELKQSLEWVTLKTVEICLDLPYEIQHQHRVQHLQVLGHIVEMILSHFWVWHRKQPLFKVTKKPND